MQALGFLPGATSSWAFATSADGSTAVGRVEYGGFGGEAFRWTAAGGMTRLLAADGLGWPSSWARGISADGAVIAGDGLRAGLIREPFRWTEQTGLTPIFPQPHTFGSGQTGGISADGSTIVGHATRAGHGGATLYFAFRWRADTGFNVLPFLPEAFGYSLARDVSGDGSVIIGDSDRIWVWDESTGIRYLDDILTNDFGVDLTGYTLEYARGISDDGTRITGLAYNHATGFHEAFIATIPGPATAGPLLLTMVAAWTRRPRRDQDRPRRHSRLRRRGQHGRGTR